MLELATYPEPRILQQALRDMALVYLDRDVVPEVLVVVLHPGGTSGPPGRLICRAPGLGAPAGVVAGRGAVERAGRGIARGRRLGLIPWVPLAKFDGPPEAILRRCRARIDAEAAAEEHDNLLAVTQVLAGLRYNDARLFDLLGGREAMIESPVLQELKNEWTREGAKEMAREATIRVLVARFGEKAGELKAELDAIDDTTRLEQLITLAGGAATWRRSGNAWRREIRAGGRCTPFRSSGVRRPGPQPDQAAWIAGATTVRGREP